MHVLRLTWLLAFAAAIVVACANGATEQTAVPMPSPEETATPASPVVAALQSALLQLEDVLPGSRAIDRGPLSIDQMLLFFEEQDRPDLAESLDSAGFVSGYQVTYGGGGERLTSVVLLFSDENGAKEAFDAFRKRVRAVTDGAFSTEDVRVNRETVLPYAVEVGDEAVGTYTIIQVEGITLDLNATLEARTILFRRGRFVASVTTTPARDEAGQLSLAQAAERRLAEALRMLESAGPAQQ